VSGLPIYEYLSAKKVYHLGTSIAQIVPFQVPKQIVKLEQKEDPIQGYNCGITSDINNQNCSYGIVLIIMFIAYVGL
jgi:hypothetical protein